MEWSKVILVLVMALGATQVVCADMVRVSGQNDQGSVPAVILDHAGEQPLPVSGVPSHFAIADLGALSVEFLPAVKPEAGGAGEPQSVCLLAERHDSFGLCLYALLGLGLCKSAPWVKRLSLGVVPGWYHDGGPLQIGHSHAISPGCRTAPAAYCLFSPYGRGQEKPMLGYHQETVVATWRTLQSLPISVGLRGPPAQNSL